jgi:hypothetical protein
MSLSGFDLENCEQLLSRDRRYMRVGIAPVKKNSFLQTIKIGDTVGTSLQVLSDLPTRRRIQLSVELHLGMSRHRAAQRRMFSELFHDQSRFLDLEFTQLPTGAAFKPTVCKIYAASFFVEILNGTYSGQNAMVLVSRKTAAKTPRIIAAVPET